MTKQKTNTIKSANKDILFSRIIEQTNWRTRQDVDTWRTAIATAENLSHPQRLQLYTLYDEILLDAHVQGLLSQRVNKLLAQKFKIIDSSGNECQVSKLLFESSWFYKFTELALESRWYGHSLIQLWDSSAKGYEQIAVVPRRHVMPERGVVAVTQGDYENGLPYREAPYNDWLIEVGAERDLGMLKVAAPSFIFKKNAMLQWSQYTEVFGMPVRVGKTASRAQVDMERMANNLRKMGSASYAVFQEGESIEFVESTKGDAYNVYDKLIERANSELSKLLIGQTMTADSGSSRSQAEVHERVADSITESDKRMLQFIVNDQLLPKMAKHGFEVAGCKFEWAVSTDLDALWSKTKDALGHYKVDAAWIQQTFGIPVQQ
jgi:ATP:corrinoid adenosyltransferase